ncbi:integral membrane protein [Nemania sp. FL0916]|nr:integral membrane protein [Nemania sp. FL0916]
MDNGSEELTAETGVGATIAALVIICVGLRFYSRHHTRAGFKLDDWLILASLLLLIATDAVVVYANGLAPNVAYIASTPGIEEFGPAAALYTEISFIATVFYFLITSTTKLSILVLYNRLFSVSKLLKRQIIILSIAVVSYGIGSSVANLLNCIPLKYSWINNLDDPRYCFNYNVFWLATGVVEAVLDVFIILLPIGAVAKLQLSLRKKIAVILVYLTGLLCIVSGILKIIYGYVPGSRVPSFGNTAIWSIVHLGTGILCACLPVCWPVFVRLGNFTKRSWGQSFGSRESRHGSSNNWSQLGGGGSRRHLRPPSVEDGLPINSERDYYPLTVIHREASK